MIRKDREKGVSLFIGFPVKNRRRTQNSSKEQTCAISKLARGCHIKELLGRNSAKVWRKGITSLPSEECQGDQRWHLKVIGPRGPSVAYWKELGKLVFWIRKRERYYG